MGPLGGSHIAQPGIYSSDLLTVSTDFTLTVQLVVERCEIKRNIGKQGLTSQ